jgi:hypothetical protein
MTRSLLALLLLAGCVRIDHAVIQCEEAHVAEAAIQPGIVYAEAAHVTSAIFSAETIHHHGARR